MTSQDKGVLQTLQPAL